MKFLDNSKMNCTVREIVMVLELAADENWVDAFYLPFDKIPDFKPIMGAYTQVLTCLMNIRNLDSYIIS